MGTINYEININSYKDTYVSVEYSKHSCGYNLIIPLEKYVQLGGGVNARHQFGDIFLLSSIAYDGNLAASQLLLRHKKITPYISTAKALSPAQVIVATKNRGLIWIFISCGHLDKSKLQKLEVKKKDKQIAFSVLHYHNKYKHISDNMEASLFTQAKNNKAMADLLYKGTIGQENNDKFRVHSQDFFLSKITNLYGATIACYRIIKWRKVLVSDRSRCLEILEDIERVLNKYKKYDSHAYKGHIEGVNLVRKSIAATTILPQQKIYFSYGKKPGLFSCKKKGYNRLKYKTE